jgi:hypothetical protein
LNRRDNYSLLFATKHHSITLLLSSSIIYINGIARHDILSLIATERSHRNQGIFFLFHSLLLQDSFQDFRSCSLRVTRELKKVSSNSDRVTLQLISHSIRFVAIDFLCKVLRVLHLIFHLIHFARDFLCPKFLGYLKTRSFTVLSHHNQ